MHESIARALAFMRTSPPMEDYEIYSALVRDGIEPRSAARLVEFLPVIYGRIILERFGVNFSHTYCRALANGGYSAPQPFTSDPVWNAAVAFARAEVTSDLAEEDFWAVARRSSELIAANKALKAGDDLKGGTSETVFLWPEEGPDDSCAC